MTIAQGGAMTRSAIRFLVLLLGAVVVAVAWRAAPRWLLLHKLYQIPGAESRLAQIPTGLDLSKTKAFQGTTCSVGYAEFVLPSTEALRLKASPSGLGVIGETDSFVFMFLPPFDPSTPEGKPADLLRALSKLPKGHPIREMFKDPATTFLDFEIYAEKLQPEPFWKGVVEPRDFFAFKTVLLGLKAGNVGLGARGMYTVRTDRISGLIRAGKTAQDVSSAHVSIENVSKSQAVGLHVRLRDEKTGDVMKVLAGLLKTFRFTTEHLDKPDEIRKAIAKAGIVAQPENPEDMDARPAR